MNSAETRFWLGTVFPFPLAGEDVLTGHNGDVAVAATNGLAAVDTGMTTQLEDVTVSVRCELMATARLPQETVGHVVAVARDLVRANPLGYPLQPGTLIPMLAERAKLKNCTVHDAVLVPPFLWNGDVPRVTEVDQGIITLPLQLLMLTDREALMVASHGANVLVDHLVKHHTDLQDWAR